MDLAESATQRRLRAECAAALGPVDVGAWHDAVAAAPGYDRKTWAALMAGGWPMIAVPSDVGGGGGTIGDLVAVAEEFGRAALPSPLHNGVIQAGLVLAAVDSAAAIDHVRALINGSRCAFADLRGDDDQCFVPYLDSAEVIVCVSEIDGAAAIFALDPAGDGVTIETVDSIGMERLGLLTVDPAGLNSETMVGRSSTESLDLALAAATVAVAADVVGAARAALDHAVRYVTQRNLFGRPVGSYQAIQHRAADMLIALTLAADAVHDAAGQLDRGEDAAFAVASAKVLAADAGQDVTAGCLQICGGEGLFADQPLHLWYRRVKAAQSMLGDQRHHRQRVAAGIFERSGD